MSVLLTFICVLATTEPVEMLPGLWVADGIVEFEGTVAMDCHHPQTPDVYLEMLITGPDSREHESLVVSDIVPSNFHAALLAAGFESGSTVQMSDTGKRASATGESLVVKIMQIAEQELDRENANWIALSDWVEHVEDESRLINDPGWGGLVFAGSLLDSKEQYLADRDGALVSLTPFGNEVISPTWILSPDAAVDEPVWIADRDLVPDIGTPLRIRIVRSERQAVEEESD